MDVLITVSRGLRYLPEWVKPGGRDEREDNFPILRFWARENSRKDFRWIGELALIGRNSVAAQTGYHPIYLEQLLQAATRFPVYWIGNTRTFFEADVQEWTRKYGRSGRAEPLPFKLDKPLRALRDDEKGSLLPESSSPFAGILGDMMESAFLGSTDESPQLIALPSPVKPKRKTSVRKASRTSRKKVRK